MNLQHKQFRLFDDTPYDDGPRRDPWSPPPAEESWDEPPHQTRMLMPTREVIDTVHKIDAEAFERPDSTPAEQWDDVRPEKHNRYLDDAVSKREPLPPLRVQHRDDSTWFKPEPELWDGHHRLAAYEKAGHAEVPVWESFDNTESGYEVKGGRAGGGYSGASPWWAPR